MLGPKRPPTIVAISDPHGDTEQLSGLVCHAFHLAPGTDITAETIRAAATEYYIDGFHFLGDRLDRGQDPVGVYNILEAIKQSRTNFIDLRGNHDHWAEGMINGFPWPEGQAEHLCQAFDEYVSYATEQQKRWEPVFAKTLAKCSKYYGFEPGLDSNGKPTGKNFLNFPEKYSAQDPDIKNDVELRDWWARILGHNVATIVYTGLHDVHEMGLGWWQQRQSELSDLIKAYPDDALLCQMQDTLDNIITEYTDNLAERDEGYHTIDKIMEVITKLMNGGAWSGSNTRGGAG